MIFTNMDNMHYYRNVITISSKPLSPQVLFPGSEMSMVLTLIITISLKLAVVVGCHLRVHAWSSYDDAMVTAGS